VYIGNHLGSSAFYVVYVKLLNTSDSPPNYASGTPSSLQPIYQHTFLVSNEKTVEFPITFSISDASISNSQSNIGTLTLNGVHINTNKVSVWNSTDSLYSYKLIFELWLLNSESGSIEYYNRYLSLKLNYTSAVLSFI